MIGRHQFQAVPAFCFDLPANTPARAAPPADAEGWLSVHDRLWVRRTTELWRAVDIAGTEKAAQVSILLPDWAEQREGDTDADSSPFVSAAAAELMADTLSAIHDQLAASVPDVVLGELASTGGFPVLTWPADRQQSRDAQREVNTARLEALRSQAAALAARPMADAGELSDEPLAAMLSQRLCKAFGRMRCPAPARVYVRPDADPPGPQIEWATQGDFDLLWGASHLEFKSGRVRVQDWAEATMHARLKLGMTRHLLSMTSAFERAFGGLDTPLRMGMQVSAPRHALSARLTVATTAWGFDLASTASLPEVTALPKGLNLSWRSRPVDRPAARD